MDPADFTAGPGRIDDYEGLPCYTPASLPPDLEYTEDLLAVYGDAQYALGRLATLARDIDNPNLLIAPFVHREAAMSSQVEGTNVTISTSTSTRWAPSPAGRRRNSTTSARPTTTSTRVTQGFDRLDDGDPSRWTWSVTSTRR